MQQKIKIAISKTVNKFVEHCNVSALFLGVLLATALPPFYQFWTVFAAFSGALFLCLQHNSAKRLSIIGYLFGCGFFAGGFYWIGNALLVDAAKTGGFYPLVMLLIGTFFGVFTIIPFAATKYGRTAFDKVLIFAALWGVVTEWVRSFILTGFPWNPISSTLAFSPTMLQTLGWWGTYGLSVVVVLTGALPVVFAQKQSLKNLWSVGASLLILLVLWGYGTITLKQDKKEIADNLPLVRLVQPSIPQALKWENGTLEDNFRKYIDLSLEKQNKAIDFVIWGETAIPFDLDYDLFHHSLVQKAVPENGYLISGNVRWEFNGRRYVPYNSLTVINNNGQIEDMYDKSHLVPFGEYMPLRRYLPDWVRPVANVVAEFGRGEPLKTIAVGKYPEFAPIICYEVIFSGKVARRENKPKWMVVVTNDGWYGQSSGPYQHLVAAQMRAIEEGFAVVRSACSGISAIITPYGVITDTIPLDVTGFVDGYVRVDLAHKTLFGSFGNVLPLLLCGLLLLAVGVRKMLFDNTNVADK